LNKPILESLEILVNEIFRVVANLKYDISHQNGKTDELIEKLAETIKFQQEVFEERQRINETISEINRKLTQLEQRLKQLDKEEGEG